MNEIAIAELAVETHESQEYDIAEEQGVETPKVQHPFLVTGDEVHRIDFGDGYWIEIRPFVTREMRDRWQDKATITRTVFTKRTNSRGKTVREPTIANEFSSERFNKAMMSDIVVTSSDGPIDVSRLRDTAVDRIKEVFEELNPGDADEDERLGESETASTPTTE